MIHNMKNKRKERRVITGSEQRTALAMGEILHGQVTRADHGGQYGILVFWPNSTNGPLIPLTGTLPEVIIKSKKHKSKN